MDRHPTGLILTHHSTRRNFLGAGLAVTVTGLLAACGAPVPTSNPGAAPTAAGSAAGGAATVAPAAAKPAQSTGELKLAIDGADLKTWLDGEIAMEYTLGSQPGPGRGGAAPHPDLVPETNAVLRPPVAGQIGLWAKTDSTSYFKDYVVSPK